MLLLINVERMQDAQVPEVAHDAQHTKTLIIIDYVVCINIAGQYDAIFGAYLEENRQHEGLFTNF